MNRAKVEALFGQLSASEVNGVPGAMEIRGEAPGPTLGITMLTHGNEPSGLEAAQTILDLVADGWAPACGRIFLIVNNIAAGMRYFAAETAEERLAARFVDTDMNRLPVELSSGEGAEVERSRALLPLWSKFDIALDLHSVGQQSAPMIVEGYGRSEDLTRTFPIGIVLRAIADVQIGAPAFAFYGESASGPEAANDGTSRRCISFEVETGWHEEDAAFRLAATCTRQLLIALSMLEAEPLAQQFDRKLYEVCGSMTVPNLSYRLRSTYPTFARCRAGEVLADGPTAGRSGVGAALAAPCDGHIIFAPNGTVPPTKAAECLFFTKPVRSI